MYERIYEVLWKFMDLRTIIANVATVWRETIVLKTFIFILNLRRLSMYKMESLNRPNYYFVPYVCVSVPNLLCKEESVQNLRISVLCTACVCTWLLTIVFIHTFSLLLYLKTKNHWSTTDRAALPLVKILDGPPWLVEMASGALWLVNRQVAKPTGKLFIYFEILRTQSVRFTVTARINYCMSMRSCQLLNHTVLTQFIQ